MGAFQRLEPAFRDDEYYRDHSVPILFAANDDFVPYTAVMIQSILDHASDQYAYDIILFHGGLAQERIDSVMAMCRNLPNVSIRFLDVMPLCQQFSLYTKIDGNRLTDETYYRLLAGEALSEAYDRVIYLDGDMIAQTDIAELCEINLDGYYLAAAYDITGIGYCHKPGNDRFMYRTNVLKLSDPDTYFIAGLLVMNLALLRRDYPGMALMELAASREWKQHDQDVLNVICNGGKAKLLHPAWNVLEDYGDNRFLPEPLLRMWLESEHNPKIVHYGGSGKPWKRDVPRQEFFWSAAARTTFFSEIVERIIQREYFFTDERLQKERQMIEALQHQIRDQEQEILSKSTLLLELAKRRERYASGTISVIIPIYNVETYLRKCLDSVINQTYQDLEIILVDDGSPDHCGAICDEYAAKDHRIKVIHKENGGVSSARNAGLAIATGEWIGWVDPDDWIEPDMFQYMLENAENSGADIAICGRIYEYPARQEDFGFESVEILAPNDALELLIQDYQVRNYLCDKLWKKELLEGVTFPETVFEDVAVVWKLFSRAKGVCGLPGRKYHYLQHSESLTHTDTLSKQLTFCEVLYQRMTDMGAEWPELQDELLWHFELQAIEIWKRYYQFTGKERKECQERLKNLSGLCRKCSLSKSADGKIGMAGKMTWALTRYPAWWSFCLAWAVWRLYTFKTKLTLHGDA